MDDSFHKNVSKNCSHGSGKIRDLCTTPRPLQSWRAQSWKPTREVEHQLEPTCNKHFGQLFFSLNFISLHAGVSFEWLFAWYWSVSSGQFVLAPVMCFVPCNLEFCRSFGYLLCWKVPMFFRFLRKTSLYLFHGDSSAVSQASFAVTVQ